MFPRRFLVMTTVALAIWPAMRLDVAANTAVASLVQAAEAGAPPAQVILYRISAETSEDAAVQGTVFAERHRWTCLRKECSAREVGRSAAHSPQLCSELAAEVGRIRVFHDGVANLNERELQECNRAALRAPPSPARASTRFSLVRAAQGYWLADAATGGRYAVPSSWLVPAEEAAQERAALAPSTEFGSAVQEIPLADDLLALRVSSYSIARAGSAQAAAGRDVFLVFDDGPRKALSEGGLHLGVTRSRSRAAGRWEAMAFRFYVSDGRVGARGDLGVLKEHVTCDAHRPELRAGSVQWHAFRDRRWIRADELRHSPASSRSSELPQLGLVKSPVQFVTEICS